jgi:hypothetical protein
LNVSTSIIVLRIVSDAIRSRRDAASSNPIESHARVCPGCARFMVGLRRTVSALGRLRSTESDEANISDGVLARLRDVRDIDEAGDGRPTA